MRACITKRRVDGLKPTGTDYYVFDTDTIGFAVRVRATGGMSYIVQYKAGSGRGAPTRRVTFGSVGKMTPEQARTAATKVLGSVAHGKDPAADKANDRRSLLLGDVIEAFLAEHAEAKRKASTAAWYRDGLERIVKPALGGMNPDKVTRQDVARLHSSLRETPVQANRVLAMLGALYGFAARAGYVPEEYNPARGVEKFPERSRERYLITDELARLGDALRLAETTGLPWRIDESKEKAKHAPKEDSRRVILDPFAIAAIWLLMLTGARLREILHARWEHVDFERGVIFLADSKTGRKPIYLSAAALAVLNALSRLEGNPHIIPGERAGQPRADLKRPWALLSLYDGQVLPLLKPHRRSGRPPASAARESDKAMAVTTVIRLFETGREIEEAYDEVAQVFRKAGIKPGRKGRDSPGQEPEITARTVRGWREEIEADVGRHTEAAKDFDRQRQSPNAQAIKQAIEIRGLPVVRNALLQGLYLSLVQMRASEH